MFPPAAPLVSKAVKACSTLNASSKLLSHGKKLNETARSKVAARRRFHDPLESTESRRYPCGPCEDAFKSLEMIYALCSQFGQADTIYEAILRLNKRMFLGVLRCRGNRETCCTAMSRQRKARKLDPAD